MKGRSRKTGKKQPKKKPTEEVTSDTVSSQATEESNAVPGGDVAIISQSAASSLPSTPKRGRGQTQKARLTSTPVHSSSTDTWSNISRSHLGTKEAELEYTNLANHLKTSELDSPCGQLKPETRRTRAKASQSSQLRKRVQNEQTQTCSRTNGLPAKCQRGRTRKVETGFLQGDTTTQSSERSRPRFELEMSDAAEQDQSLMSSDLSIELSHHEEQFLSLSFQEDERSADEDEEELPSFLMQVDKKPPSITEGLFVWCKFRCYPFWPALVKSVNRKQKKASIMFIDDPIIHKKGFTVALKTLKPFDCEEANELVFKAKEKYASAIEWSLELITDYRIRIACGSFSGSFIEYFAHDMSYPVRRQYPQAASERLTIASDTMMESLCDDPKEDSFSKQQEKVRRSPKRLLPDRSLAAYNRANEKLVHFIVKQRMVEARLLAVIHGQQQSRWLHSFLSASRKPGVNIYLADDQQLDQVYLYLNELYATAVAATPCLPKLTFMEHVPFILDVLLPEAITYAIAGLDNIPVEKAEEKYLKGRCMSNRERQELERWSDLKIKHQKTSLALLSDPFS
ncbi:PWWP domain-containing DNA repair factor 3B-like isoform X2 [Etheostoma cragini]|uniref:PWWP domain-containing DNA repair factor 3B-like isoform X2 n=1 Tax=Etheostoma cragini TaxID=417921 RepID=UPI00155E2B09|nr:PWWP domain-containing DNA repair factor 3B-like isoform X2 [Etheostoma cragini]